MELADSNEICETRQCEYFRPSEESRGLRALSSLSSTLELSQYSTADRSHAPGKLCAVFARCYSSRVFNGAAEMFCRETIGEWAAREAAHYLARKVR